MEKIVRDLNLSKLPQDIAAAIKEIQDSQYYTMKETNVDYYDGKREYYPHRPWYNVMIYIISQINNRTIGIVLIILKCLTLGNAQNCEGLTSFSSLEAMKENFSSHAYSIITEYFHKLHGKKYQIW